MYHSISDLYGGKQGWIRKAVFCLPSPVDGVQQFNDIEVQIVDPVTNVFPSLRY
jgi:hypothetical protein